MYKWITHCGMVTRNNVIFPLLTISTYGPGCNSLVSSSTTLAGLPAHMIIYSFTDEEDQTPLQNLQAWTIKNGMAYVITYGGTPEE
jgi:hypothetical protein